MAAAMVVIRSVPPAAQAGSGRISGWPCSAESGPRDASGVVAELRIKLSQRVRSIFLILGRKILSITAYFAAAHLEGLRITHIAGMQDLGIKYSGCLQFLHVLEPGKLERVLKD